MWFEHLNYCRLIWQESLIGGVVIVVFVFLGIYQGRTSENIITWSVKWWLDHVVRVIVSSPSWLFRTAAIAANNTLVCFAAVVLGALVYIAWIGIACIGFSLGIALTLMTTNKSFESDEEQSPFSRKSKSTTIGLVLNLLEVPAIMLSAGLSLAQGALGSTLNLSQAITTFALIVIPLLLISAAGESLWMDHDSSLSKLWPTDSSDEFGNPD